MSDKCRSPVCRADLGPMKRRDKKFCCDKCRLDGWALTRAAKLLFRIEPSRWYEILGAAGLNEKGQNSQAKRA